MKDNMMAYKILSIILILNILCCSIPSAILGIFSLVYVIKQSNTEEDLYKDKIKVLLTFGYLIFVINAIISFILSFGETITKLLFSFIGGK